MSVPIVEQITQNVTTTLQNISITNGYNNDVTVERELQHGNKPGNKKFVVFQGDPETVEDEVLLKTGWKQPYLIDIYVEIPDGDDTPPSQVLNSLWADAFKALMVDRTRGDLAIDTKIQPPQEFKTIEGEFHGRQFVAEVYYRTLELDPYTAG